MMFRALLEELARAPDADPRLRGLAADGLVSAVQLASMRRGRAVFVLFADGVTTPAAVVKVDHDPPTGRDCSQSTRRSKSCATCPPSRDRCPSRWAWR